MRPLLRSLHVAAISPVVSAPSARAYLQHARQCHRAAAKTLPAPLRIQQRCLSFSRPLFAADPLNGPSGPAKGHAPGSSSPSAEPSSPSSPLGSSAAPAGPSAASSASRSSDASGTVAHGDLKDLPSHQESQRSEMSKKFSTKMDDLQTVLFNASQKLNDVTGYSGIEALKKSIEQQEANVQKARLEVRDAKEDYQAAINRRSASQREVNELLQRKHAWSAADLERFTELYRSDHANEQAESAAQDRLTHAERVADEAQAQLARSILARYHEEQIWSDKIRRASTWGTWGLMGFNVLLFIVVQLGLEPWKRRRLVGGFEEKVREVIQQESMRNAIMHIEPQEEKPVDEAAVEAVEALTAASALAQEAAAAMEVEEQNKVEEASEDRLEEVAAAAATEEAIGAAPAPAKDETSVGEIETVIEEAVEPERAPGVYGALEETYQNATRRWQYLFSERKVVITQAELTTAVVQSAGVGALLAALISLMLSHR